MDLDNNQCISCSLKSKAVSALNDDELCFLEKSCSRILFKKGELVFKEGTPVNSICYVRRGFVKLSKQGIGEKDYILSVVKMGAYLGIQNLNSRSKKNFFSAIAIADSEICFINIECFYNLLKQNGEFAIEVISAIFNDEMNYFERLVNNVQQQLPGRLANAILYFSKQVYEQNPFDLNLTRTELASLIGTSRESVSRILKEFQDSGFIKIDKSKITILDLEKLCIIQQRG